MGPPSSQMVPLRLNSMHNRFMVRRSTPDLSLRLGTSHEHGSKDRYCRVSRPAASGDGRSAGRSREHRFRQLQQTRGRRGRGTLAGPSRSRRHRLRDHSQRHLWRLHGGAAFRQRGRPADRADGSSRYSVPRRDRRTAPVSDRWQSGLRPGGRRHEGGPGHEYFRPRSVAPAWPSSRPVIEAEAKGARAVFNAEPGRPSGNLVSRRKGAAFIELEVTGRAAHSGAAHAQGISAIEAMARKIQRLHRLTDYDLGTTVNVGLTQGGISVNTVAARATAAIDVRFPTLNIMEKILGEVREICRCCELPGSDSRIVREGNFLPLEQDEASHKLLKLYDRSAAGLAFRVEGEATGGSADSGFTAALGTPTLCGTGPVGGNVHTDEEWCRIDTIVPRAQALALTILEVAASPL